ncbi:MAG: type II toxin-antitoxin system prevent-host-death family antitoxin [Actinobacteria bacterium]|nr:type II toxin-antitoxin system prevent-host-death family antitoxin [Actinomycetota bacterium]
MTRVGVRELKAHLSQYLRQARAGETVVITERGREIATLTGIGQREGLRELIERGVVKWSGAGLDVTAGTPVHVHGEPLSKTVLDQRGPR